jgi:hypothetical protein
VSVLQSDAANHKLKSRMLCNQCVHLSFEVHDPIQLLICSLRTKSLGGGSGGTYICGAIEVEIPSCAKAEIWARWASREAISRYFPR